MSKLTKRQQALIQNTLQNAVVAVRDIPAAALAEFIPMLEQAKSLLLRDLTAFELLEDGAARYTAQKHRSALVQLDAAMKEIAALGPAMATTLTTHGGKAGLAGLNAMEMQLAAMDTMFTGAMVPISIDRAAVLSKGDQLLLKRYPRSAAKYAGTIGAQVRSKLAVGVLRQQSIGEMTNSLSKEIPLVFKTAKSDAHRLIRTECLPGDQVVSGAAVTSAHRRWFEGPMVEIITESGRKISGTTNHPMLTTRGWVGAGSIGEGDYLVCYAGQQLATSPGDENIATGPTTISEIFDSLSAVGVGERRRTAEPDFHGDGIADSHVDIFSPDGVLGYGQFATIGKPSIEISLPESDFSGSSFCPECRRLLPVNKRPCLCGTSELCASAYNPSLHEDIRPSDVSPDRVTGLTAKVPGHEISSIDGSVCPGVVPRRVKHGPGLREAPNNSFVLNELVNPPNSSSDLGCDLASAEAGEIEADRVVSVIVREFSGHVFNLSTVCGYFAIDGAYTGNTMNSYNTLHHEGLIDAHREDSEVKMRWDASYDFRRCPECGDLDGRIVEVAGEFKASWKTKSGLSKASTHRRPPAHPNCRCILVPWMDDFPDQDWNVDAPEIGEPTPEASRIFGRGVRPKPLLGT